MTGQHHHIHGGGFCRACIVYGAGLGAEETLRAGQEAAKGDAALADAESGPDQRDGETKPAGGGLCACDFDAPATAQTWWNCPVHDTPTRRSGTPK